VIAMQYIMVRVYFRRRSCSVAIATDVFLSWIANVELISDTVVAEVRVLSRQIE